VCVVQTKLSEFVDSLAGDQLPELAAESSQQQRVDAAEGLYSVIDRSVDQTVNNLKSLDRGICLKIVSFFSFLLSLLMPSPRCREAASP